MYFFKTIRRGIITLFSLLLGITLLISIAFFLYELQLIKVERNLTTLNQINASIIRLGSIERDLFISESINPDFYEDNTNSFLLENKREYQELLSQIKGLREQSEYLESNSYYVLKLEKELEKYRILYDTAATLIRKKGWKDYGVEGRMRTLIHDIENANCNLSLSIVLMSRRHEKDFLLRKQEKYKELFLEVNMELRDNIMKACNDYKKRDTLLQWHSDYVLSFLELVELEKKIGYTNKDGIKEKLTKETSNINIALKNLNLKYLDEVDKLRFIARSFLISTLVLALLLNTLVVFYLVRKFANPIKRLTESIMNSVNNNFDKSYKIEQIKSDDEIGKLSASFEYMLINVQERTDIILEKNAQIEQSFQELKRLSKLGREIASKLEDSKVIEKAYKSVKKLVAFDFFAIGLFDKNAEKLVFANFEKSDELQGTTTYRNILDEKSLTVYSFIHQKKIFIKDITTQYQEFLESLPNDDEELYHSLIYLPLTYLDTKLGVMVIKKREKDFFSYFDYNIMKNMALYVSLALQNSDSYKTLQDRNIQIDKQKNELELQHDQIKASIRQAHTMQLSFLPTYEQLAQGFKYALLYKPKDIVSGDFYWYKKIESSEYEPYDFWMYAVVDCTGHGVPGALLTLIGTNLLEEIVSKENNYNPAYILEKMDERVRHIFKQNENLDSKDGMDVAICRITPLAMNNFEVIFAGAKRPLYYFNHKTHKIITEKGSRRTIGGTTKISKEYFINQEIELHKDDVLFLTTDGYVDQHDAARKRFGTGKFLELIEEIASMEPDIQIKVLDNILKVYMQNEEQRDDITVLSLTL